MCLDWVVCHAGLVPVSSELDISINLGDRFGRSGLGRVSVSWSTCHGFLPHWYWESCVWSTITNEPGKRKNWCASFADQSVHRLGRALVSPICRGNVSQWCFVFYVSVIWCHTCNLEAYSSFSSICVCCLPQNQLLESRIQVTDSLPCVGTLKRKPRADSLDPCFQALLLRCWQLHSSQWVTQQMFAPCAAVD